MKRREMVLEFYDRILQIIEPGKEYPKPDLYKISENLIETHLRPKYGKLVDKNRLKEQVGFLLGYLMRLLDSEETSRGVIFYKTSISKEKLEEVLDDWKDLEEN